MNLAGICVFTLRASAFASVVCAAYALILRMRRKVVLPGRLLAVFYLAALIQITVIRGGVNAGDVLHASRDAVQWLPMKTTLEQWRLGAWPFVYHVVGNLMWFVPLGAILRKKPIWVALFAGMLLSVAIEGMQWVLLTGMTDIDDVLINTCGTLIGFLCARGCARKKPVK